MNVDELALTKMLVFGTTTPDPNPNRHIRADAPPSAAEPRPRQSYNMLEYLTTGAGRYALPADAPLIRSFFNDSLLLPTLVDGTYSAQQVRNLLKLTVDEGSLEFSVSQYWTDPLSSDFMERAYVFGSTSFLVKESGLLFKVSGGSYSVESVEVRAYNDNFDFQSSNPIAATANVLLNQALDPYGLIPVVGGNTTSVEIVFTGDGRLDSVYTAGEYAIDRAYMALASGPLQLPAAGVVFSDASAGLATNTGYLGQINADLLFRYYTADGKKVIYGTPGDDNLNVRSAELTADVYFSYRMVGGAGNDTIKGGVFGDELWGGDGSDVINGGLGDDRIIGGSGDDTIEGGSFVLGTFEGNDVAVYGSAFADYRILFQPGGWVEVIDNNASRDGRDKLTGVERAEFSDRTVSLRPGQDLAFVVDTTGSMWDDIDAVKAQSSAVINAIFEPSRNLLDSRIAVVGYNDPYTETFLNFTDHPDPEDRKTAAQQAINSLYAAGGDDFEELTYSGLLRALNGGAGEWRPEASSRKIILFGDATAKDGHLASTVFALAANLNADIRSTTGADYSITSTSLGKGIEMTSISIRESDTSSGGTRILPVQIFTVAIGGYGPTIDEFEDIADTTNGSSFTVTGASEIVEALLAVINLPIYTVSSDVESIIEGNTGVTRVLFTVSRDVADRAAEVTLGYSGSADAQDVLQLPSSVSFATGETNKQIEIFVRGDVRHEADEALTLSLDAVSEPSTFSGAASTVIIVNDDPLGNQAPVAWADNAFTKMNTAVSIKVLANDSDPDGDPLTVTGITPGSRGNVSIENAGVSVRYVPNPGYSGFDNFSYTVGDGAGGSATANVQVLVASITGSSGNDTQLGTQQVDHVLGLNGDDRILTHDGADYVDGGRGADTITGGAGGDTLLGGDGPDTFLATSAELAGDQIDGGNGTDILVIGNALAPMPANFSFTNLEQISFSGGLLVEHTSLLDLSSLVLASGSSNNITGGVAHSRITGTGSADNIVDSAGNDNLHGAGGNDTIQGGFGQDTILGGTGNDVLYGGSATTPNDFARDVFVFDTPLNAATNVDQIIGFQASNQDQIRLDSSLFSAVTGGATPGLDADEFRSVNGGSAQDANDHIVFDPLTGNLFYDADGNGGGVKVLFATLVGLNGTLDVTDFVVGGAP